MVPLLAAASIASLLLTSSAVLPSWRISWVNKTFRFLFRSQINDAEYGKAIHQKNQFGVGEPNFNLMAIWLIFLPGVVLFVTYIHTSLNYAEDPLYLTPGKSVQEQRIEYISYTAGWAGTVVLSFFLIPVTRHSVLLVAMNWSPVHALHIHVWAGYLSFFLIFLHGILLVGVWFKFAPSPIYREFIPPKQCWTGAYPEDSRCGWQFYNFTGMVAFVFFLGLLISSLNWFRRKWYRLFYILHVTFGTLTLLASIWHYEFIGLYLLPSILYYLASTMPTLVQALASRFRGGIKIVQVMVLEDAGDCLEVRISTDPTAQAILADNHPSKYVKLCVPQISIVWHPFTVYRHQKDPETLRMLFRPVGPFTKQLHSHLVAPDGRPVTLIDGLYRGGDHCQEALSHDHISIVAGGVAITPFLSMIQSVLKVLATSRRPTTATEKQQFELQSMTLIWSCREAGLMSFVKKNYLEDIAHSASVIPGFQFKIKIYCTGKGFSGTFVPSENEFSEISASDIAKKQLNSEAAHSNLKLHDDTGTTAVTDSKDMHPFPDKEMKENLTLNRSSCADDEKGHAMELARMMPARNAQIQWNLPYFTVFSGSIWLGFHLMFFPYDDVALSYRDKSEQVWITMLVVGFFFGVGVAVEMAVLFLRPYWPAPRPDNFDLLVLSPKQLDVVGDEEELAPAPAVATTNHEEDNAATKRNAAFGPESVFETHHGRPGPSDIFADAALASAPGIFMCGPVPLMRMVRTEARRWEKNDASAVSPRTGCLGAVGWRRFALYEETFEM